MTEPPRSKSTQYYDPHAEPDSCVDLPLRSRVDFRSRRPDGDRTTVGKLRYLMVTFTPDFEILPGTAPTQRQVPPGRSFALPGSGKFETD